jgi:hypothetical protein
MSQGRTAHAEGSWPSADPKGASAEVLLPHGHPLFPEFFRILEEEFGYGQIMGYFDFSQMIIFIGRVT